jgi:hypothetical protein
MTASPNIVDFKAGLYYTNDINLADIYQKKSAEKVFLLLAIPIMTPVSFI